MKLPLPLRKIKGEAICAFIFQRFAIIIVDYIRNREEVYWTIELNMTL